MPTKKINKWNLNNADWDSYKKLTKIKETNILPNSDIDQIILTFTNNIQQAALETIGYKKDPHKRKSVPWWNKTCETVTKQLKKALYKYRKTRKIEDLIHLKQCRAKSRRTIVESKTKSWINYTSTITPNTPTTQIWDKIRKVKGTKRSVFTTTVIKDQKIITSPQDIVETLADTFYDNSSDKNYDKTFIEYKNNAEKQEVKIIYTDNDINKPFTTTELEYAIKNMKDQKTPGPDGITTELIKNLPSQTIEYLLSIYNYMWINKTYPNQWREVVTYPILKPGKNKSDTDNYRPISASNTLSKIMQAMVNKRLIWYLENNNILSRNQAGFRKGRSTTDNILQLTTEVQKAFKQRQHLIAVFFDLQKAYDMTWRHHILKSLKECGIDGLMLNYIKLFLQERYYRVLTNGFLSNKKKQENGVPQGETISATLFLIAINKITHILPNTVNSCLFADDLLIFAKGKNLNRLKYELQAAISNLEDWTSNTGFKFSTSKTKAIHFNKQQYNKYNPLITLKGLPIEYVENQKFLGVTFDVKLNWKRHILNLKKECTQRLNIMKTLAHHKWGANRDILLRIYFAFIRSKLDYGAVAYSTAKKSYLKILEPIQNTAIRIATGALRTSPTISILKETNQLPLEYRRAQLSMTYINSLIKKPQIPVHNSIFQNINEQLQLQNTLPIHNNIRDNLAEFNLTLPIPKIKHTKRIPPWTLQKPIVNLDLTIFPKHNTHPNTYITLYKELQAKQKNYKNIFTDGSKIDQAVGAAVLYEEEIQKFHLPDSTSVYTAEVYAMLKASEIIHNNKEQRAKYAIYTDSLSTIISSGQLYTEDPLIQVIQNNFHEAIQQGQHIVITWIPSHVGISGNDKVDEAAKEATVDHITPLETQEYDVKNHIKNNIKKKWNTLWQTVTNNHLKEVIGETTSKPQGENRKEQITLCRLKIGHTLLTHTYFFERREPTTCNTCNTKLTVKHLLLECPEYSTHRRRNNIPQNLSQALTNPQYIVKTIQYLKDINIYNKI